jgi:transcription factor E2F2
LDTLLRLIFCCKGFVLFKYQFLISGIIVFEFLLQGLQMYMKSENGEIEVFLCPEESTVNDENSEHDSGTVNEPAPSCSSVHYGHQQTISESVVEYSTELVAAASDPSSHIDMRQPQISDEYVIKDEPVSKDAESPSKLTRIRNVLISEPDDFEPMGGGRFQLQTEDQHNIHVSGEQMYGLCKVCVVWYQLPLWSSGQSS